MPRLRNTTSGVVVNVDDATAARLVGDWKPHGEGAEQDKPAPKKSTRRKASTTKDDE